MQLNPIKKFKQDAKELDMPIWKLPDILLLVGTFLNIILMIIIYIWASKLANDPREAVFLVAVFSILILFINNIVVESSKKIIVGNRLKKEFIDIISHQIRSPLTNIKWSLESLEDSDIKCLNDNQKGKIYDAIKSSEKVISLLGDFIYLSRINDKKQENLIEKINVTSLIEMNLLKFESFASSKNIKLKLKNQNKKIFIKTSKEKVSIVVNNLIDNALKYGNENSKVVLELKEKDKRVFFTITNLGLGIKEEEKNDIFVKFYRGENGKKIVSSGTGLGLYICKKLLKEIKGKIWFKSIPGGKTIFYVELEDIKK